MTTTTQYDRQRPKVTPPHVSLANLRAAAGITLDDLAARIADVTGKAAPSRGALSAIERGHRGASDDLLRAIALAYGMPEDAVSTTYRPRSAPTTTEDTR